jgi:hypothetical protein
MVLAYKLLHESGEFEGGEYPLPPNGTPQQMGSAITYARRYTFCAVTGVVSEEDDDGKAAPQEREPTSRPRQPRQPSGRKLLSDKQRGMIISLMTKAGLKDRDQVLDWIETTVGRRVDSRNELFVDEASKIIEILKADEGINQVTGEVTPEEPAEEEYR